MSSVDTATVTSASSRSIGIRAALVLAGALAVALAAQFSLPLPGTPVPFTFSPLAVLVVGALLGPRLGAASLITYIVMGAAHLPVFAPGGAIGLARLLGPTGGYLLAYPFAAWFVGWAVRRSLPATPSFVRTLLSCLAGMGIIFAGGLAQLTILTGDPARAFAAGALPFVAADLAKVLLAALIVGRTFPYTRALS